MDHTDLIQTGRLQGQGEGVRYILCPHGGAELPGHDEAREVVQHGGEIIPAPARDLEIREVRLPELIQQFSFWWTGVRPKDPTGLEKDWAASFGRLGLIQGRDGGARQPAERRAALL